MSSHGSAPARSGDHPPSFEPIHEQAKLVKPENGRDANRPIVQELGDRMKHARQELMTQVAAQETKIIDLHDHLDTMSRAIRKASGVDLANPDLDLIQEQVHKFERAVVEIHAKWTQLKAIAEAAPAPTPAPAPAEAPVDKKRKKKHHHSDKPVRGRAMLGEHHWQESEEDKDPILDIPSSVLEKIIPAARYMEAYEAIARDKDRLGAPSASGEPVGLTKIKELFDPAILQAILTQDNNNELKVILREQGHSVADFQDLWKEKLSTKIYHVLEQVVREDVGQMAEQKMTRMDKFIINAPTIAAKATVSGLTIGLAAGTAGAAATFAGLGVGTTMAASGLAGATAHRTKTTWWSWAREAFNNIGKTGAENREKSKKIKREDEALEELLKSAQSGATEQAQFSVTDHTKTREMASWISQGLRDASAAETIAHEAKPSNTAQKTGLRERDDANLYLLRMRAAERLADEPDAELKERREAKLDELTNGLNRQRETAAGQATYLENVYKTNTGYAQAKRDVAVANGAENRDKKGSRYSALRTLGGGMLVGTTIMELGGIPVGPVLGGAILGRDRGTQKNAEVITKGFEANVKKVVVDAKKLVDEVRVIVRHPTNQSKSDLLRKNKELEVILNSGVLKKDHKALELAVRDTLHDGRRLYLAEDLDREQNGPAGAREETEKQVKRLTKKPGTFWRKTRNVFVGAVIAVGLNLSARHAVEKIHTWRDIKPVDPPEAVPTAVVPEAVPDQAESDSQLVVKERRPAEPEVAAPKGDAVEDDTGKADTEEKPVEARSEIKKEDYVKALTELRAKVDGWISPDTITYLGGGENKYKEILGKIDAALAKADQAMDEDILLHLKSGDDLFEKWLQPDILKDPELALVFATSEAGDVQASGHALLFFSEKGEAVYLYAPLQVFEKVTPGPLVVTDLDSSGGVIKKFAVKDIHYQNGELELVPGPAVQ